MSPIPRPAVVDPPPLRPARALTHPAWLAALAMLAVNDHVLKGAGWLPGVVTGKLSDVAGLIVAPVLLATVLAVRSRRGLLAAHLAVGAVFTAMQLSAPVAEAVTAITGVLGVPWHITRDWTDALTLPALAASWWLLLPDMSRRDRPHPAAWPMGALGLALCLATSPPREGTWDTGGYAPFEAGVWLSNQHPDGDTLHVEVRELRADVGLDCAGIAEDPGRLLTEPLFGEAVTWQVPANANIPAATWFERACGASLVSVVGFDDVVLFWHRDDVEWGQVEGDSWGAWPTWDWRSGGVAIGIDGPDGLEGYHDGGAGIAFAPHVDHNGICALPADRDRLASSTDFPKGPHVIDAKAVSLDGCLQLTLREPGASSTEAHVLCAPAELFPFEAGDTIAIAHEPSSLLLRSEDLATELCLWRGVIADSQPCGVSFDTIVDASCKPWIDATCGTVGVPASAVVTVGASSQEMSPGGTPATFSGGAGTVQVQLPLLQRQLAAEPSCGAGAPTIGHDLELVVLSEP